MVKVINSILVAGLLLLASCQPKAVDDINIGFIGPLSGNAVDLGVAPSKAMELAVRSYNERREVEQPKVNFFVSDDGWSGDNAVPLYDKLRKEHGIDILFISHTDGTIALQERVERDGVILVNSLNNDTLLSTMNENTFMIGKKTEEAAMLVAARVIELGKRKVRGFYVTNSFMTISADAFAELLSQHGVDGELIPVDISKEDYLEELRGFVAEGCDALVFFGYKNLGFAMKQARDLGMDVSFFASTTTLGAGYFENSDGAMVGTEFSFFTENDGNYILAKEFLGDYRSSFGEDPFSVWPAMQAYDAMNMVLGCVGRSGDRPGKGGLTDWLRGELLKINYYQGVCGNIAILADGSSRGIYFSLYVVDGNGVVRKVKR